MKRILPYILSACLVQLVFVSAAYAQGKTKIEIQNAELFEGKVINGAEVRILRHNVVMKHDNALMYCDSAYVYAATNSMKAYGDVHVNHNDSVHMYGNWLEYDGNTKHAIVHENVRLLDHEMTLRTERLDYNMKDKRAWYLTGGTITDIENTLTSQRGYYHSSSGDMFFRKDVRLVNPQYVMTCDTLQYNVESHIAYFHGPTHIVSEKDKIYCESGWYNTDNNTAEFGKNAYLNSENQFLYGDRLYYDRNLGFGKAINNVRVHDTSERLLIEGQYAEHYQDRKETFITQDILVTKGFEKDSLYISADTLRSLYDSTGEHRILKGFHNAEMYSKDFQGKADSITYYAIDSTIDMRVKPVIWFGKYQTTAEHIVIFTKNNDIERAEFYQNSFILMPEDTVRFSQIKGRDMTAYFIENELKKIDVIGNGESIYYARDDDSAFIGMNRITSSNIRIMMEDQQLKQVNFINSPEGRMVPMNAIHPQDARLKGFIWRRNERPESVEDIRRR